MQPAVGPALSWEAAAAEGVDRKDSAGSLCTSSPPLSTSSSSPLSEPETAPSPEPVASPTTHTLDLLSLVVAFKRLEIFAEPLYDFWEMVKYLIRWKAPLCSLLCCLTLNVLFLALSEAGWFILLAIVISTPAVLGYLQDCCQEQLTEQALAQRKSHSVRREDLQKVKITRQEALVEIKTFLIHLDDLLNKTCVSCEAAYRVLYWEDHTLSVLFYGTLLGILSVLYLLPLCWVLALLNSVIFLGNADFYQVINDYKGALLQNFRSTPEVEEEVAVSESEGAMNQDVTPTASTPEEVVPGNMEEQEQEQDDEFKDAIEEDDDGPQCSGDYDLTMQDNGFFKNEPIRSKVSKLTEKLRKRYPTNNYGSCSSCCSTFSVLKKRRNCSNCGNSYCSRCCSYKVPKSSMGATAPDAQRETVFVCAQCYFLLSK
ncbi:LOW QUALITY PROTEIN: protrudin [Pristis pectinata]|uniref:LOW QUALITY PROTEIN: protrudin n=1 Tax=Pristis pectinata TaxID=685728 RepID=UPI00223DE545|nr:LOW QUALITY PROTEIN: protrudin [Pristis pectinata]